MALYIVPLSGILMGVLVLGLIFFVLLHTKETALAMHFKGALAIPRRQTTFRRSVLRCAALRYRQTGAVMKKRKP